MAKIIRHYGQGNENLNVIPHLPLDIIFQILILLPADFLHNTGKLVCKSWANMIRHPSFIKKHLVSSTRAGLLLQEYDVPPHGYFYDMEGGSFIAHSRQWLCGKPLDSLRGLCLFFFPYDWRLSLSQKREIPMTLGTLYIVNPATREVKLLPSIGDELILFCQLAYIVKTGHYVVICFLKRSGILYGLVFTVGIDVSWRRINLPLARGTSDRMVRPTSAIAGHVAYLSVSGIEILAIDLHDETTCLIQLPNGRSYLHWLLKMGEDLSCVIPEQIGITVYVLSNSKKCEWSKVCEIGDEITRNVIPLFCLAPIGWLDKGRIIVLESESWCSRVWNSILAVNLETGEVAPLYFSPDAPHRDVLIHTNTLVKW